MTTTTTNNNGQNPAFTFSFDGELPYFSVNYSLNIEGNKNTFKKELTSKKTKFKARRGAELSNQLQNTLATVSDRKYYVYQNKLLQYGQAEVVTSQDYYPFGMEMMGSSDLYSPTNTNEYSGRVYHNKSLTDRNFRYGFNGKEKDDAFHDDITNYDYGFRIYNPGISRFLSVDPLTRDYPFYSPYQFAGNNPIRYIDLDGLEPADPPKSNGTVIGLAKAVGQGFVYAADQLSLQLTGRDISENAEKLASYFPQEGNGSKSTSGQDIGEAVSGYELLSPPRNNAGALNTLVAGSSSSVIETNELLTPGAGIIGKAASKDVPQILKAGHNFSKAIDKSVDAYEKAKSIDIDIAKQSSPSPDTADRSKYSKEVNKRDDNTIHTVYRKKIK